MRLRARHLLQQLAGLLRQESAAGELTDERMGHHTQRLTGCRTEMVTACTLWCLDASHRAAGPATLQGVQQSVASTSGRIELPQIAWQQVSAPRSGTCLRPQPTRSQFLPFWHALQVAHCHSKVNLHTAALRLNRLRPEVSGCERCRLSALSVRGIPVPALDTLALCCFAGLG